MLEAEKEEEAPESKCEPEHEAEMKTDGSFPLCIGPGCSKKALPESVYCGTDCILQHAAFTMKTLTVSKVPKPKGRAQKKDVSATPTTKVRELLPQKMCFLMQMFFATSSVVLCSKHKTVHLSFKIFQLQSLRSTRTSKRLAEKAEEKGQTKEDVGGQVEATPSPVCDLTPTEVQTSSPPSSQFCAACTYHSPLIHIVFTSRSPSCQKRPLLVLLTFLLFFDSLHLVTKPSTNLRTKKLK